MMNNNKNRLHEKMNYRPVLIIGLGGVGTNVVRHTLRWINHLTGQKKVPPFIKILCFDTDSQATGNDKLPFLLEDVQFFNLGGFSAGRLLNAAKNRSDDPDLTYLKPFNEAQLKPGQIHRGAHGIPRIGRLCYTYNRNKRVIPVLTQAILELLDLTLPYDCNKKGYPLHSGNITPTIHFISSVCGGTGAGIMLDIAIDVRQLVLQYSNNDPDMIAHLILPPVFQSQSNPLDQMHQRNTYYLLRQIDYLMGGDRLGKIFLTASNLESSELREYEILYDTIYIINRRLKNKANTEKHIGRMIAALCLEPLGLDINSMWDNIRMGRIDADPVQIYCGYGFKSYRSPYEIIVRLMCDEFLKYLKNTIVDVKHDDMKDNKAQQHIDRFSYDNLFNKVNVNQVEKQREDLKRLITLKVTHIDINDEFWKTTIQKMKDNDIDFLERLLKYAQNVKPEQENKLDKLELDILKKGLPDTPTEKELKKLLEETTGSINDCNKGRAECEIMKYLEAKRSCLVGSEIINILERHIEELCQTSEGFINMDITYAISTVKKWFADLPKSIWKQEYISLVEKLLKYKREETRKAVVEWINNLEEQYKKEFTQNFSEHQEEIHKQMEQPGVNTFMLFDIAGGSGVDTLTFLQSSLHSNDDHEKSGYQVCICSENCDLILCKTHMGIQLNHLKDFATGYYNAFKQAYCKQKSLWGKPLFDIECDKSKQEIEDHIIQRIFKIRNKGPEGNSGEK